MVAITRSGMIRVLYQGLENRWQDFKSESETIASLSELLTHATMCPEKIADHKSSDKGECNFPCRETALNETIRKSPTSCNVQ